MIRLFSTWVGALTLLAGLVAAPAILWAQSTDESAQLRQEIRAAIMADPRSSELSEEEVTIMVESLAGEAERQGVAEDFIPLPTFTPGEFETVANPFDQFSEPMLYGIVLVSLALAMVLLKHVFDLHHRTAASVDAPSQPV